MFNEKKFHLKRHWKDCVITSKRVVTSYFHVQSWKKNVHLSNIHQTFFWQARNIAHESDCVAQFSKKEQLESLYIFPKGKLAW